jgi:hypothetical protein
MVREPIRAVPTINAGSRERSIRVCALRRIPNGPRITIAARSPDSRFS